MPDSPILVINTGSSSLKFGLYTQAGNDEQLLLDGLADGLGQPSGKLTIKDPDGLGGMPGNVTVTVTYTVLADNTLALDYQGNVTGQ